MRPAARTLSGFLQAESAAAAAEDRARFATRAVQSFALLTAFVSLTVWLLLDNLERAANIYAGAHCRTAGGLDAALADWLSPAGHCLLLMAGDLLLYMVRARSRGRCRCCCHVAC